MFVLNHSRPRPRAYASDSWPSCAEELWGNKQYQCACSLKDIFPRSYSRDSQDNNSREKYISEIYAFSSTRQTLWNLILFCRTKLKTLIQTSCFCHAYVELNSRIKFGTRWAEARRMNWALFSATPFYEAFR